MKLLQLNMRLSQGIAVVLTAVQVSLTPTHLFPSRLNLKKIKLSISNCCNPLVSQ